MTTCIRACIVRGQHLVQCSDDTCLGCKLRQARHELLCETCHARMVDWLSGQHGLVWTHAWLTEVLERPSTVHGAREDWQRPGSDEGPPTPLRLAIFDLRRLLTDRLFTIDGAVREEFDRPEPGKPYDLAASCAFLHAWLTKAEAMPSLIVWMYDEIHEVMRDAGALAPWRDVPRKISNIPCPDCEVEALVVFGGDEHVTCRHCWAVHNRARYNAWIRTLIEITKEAS